MRIHPDLLIAAVTLRSACDMRRAWRPIWESPWLFKFCFGVRACNRVEDDNVYGSWVYECVYDFEGLFTVVGLRYNEFLISTPSFAAYWGSSACSASINAAVPPFFCTSAIAWRARVVLPDDSGPNTSLTIRPFDNRHRALHRAWVIHLKQSLLAHELCHPITITAPCHCCFSIILSAAWVLPSLLSSISKR